MATVSPEWAKRYQVRTGTVDTWGQDQYQASADGAYHVENDPNRTQNLLIAPIDATQKEQFGNAIQRRISTVDEIGQQQNQFASQQADKQQVTVQNEIQQAQQKALIQAQQQQQSAMMGAYNSTGAVGSSNYYNPSSDATYINNGITYGPTGSVRRRIVNLASQQAGTKYVWGAEQPGKAFDCSGLVQYVYGQMGIKMPRVAKQQALVGTTTPINRLKPGDLVGWGSSPATAHHIAIYAGNGHIWEAVQPGTPLRTRAISPQEQGIFGVALNL